MTQIMCETYDLKIMNVTFYVPPSSRQYRTSLCQSLLHLDIVDRDFTVYIMMIFIEREYSEINTVEYGIVMGS